MICHHSGPRKRLELALTSRLGVTKHPNSHPTHTTFLRNRSLSSRDVRPSNHEYQHITTSPWRGRRATTARRWRETPAKPMLLRKRPPHPMPNKPQMRQSSGRREPKAMPKSKAIRAPAPCAPGFPHPPTTPHMLTVGNFKGNRKPPRRPKPPERRRRRMHF